MSGPDMTPLFDDVARDGRQGELASVIRSAVLIQPFGPNSLAVHAAGGAVHLTSAEAEDAARAVLESGWLAEIVARHVKAALTEAAERTDQAASAWFTQEDVPDSIRRAVAIAIGTVADNIRTLIPQETK